MLSCCIDHIVITAPSLDAGVEYVRAALGVSPQTGGEHARMGTHNALLRLGEATYLEVIAPNPNAPKPKRPRWFQLDSLAPDAKPCVATWVVRTNDIQGAAAAVHWLLGSVEPMSRGKLNWLITIPADGSLPARGIAPTLIQWLSESHPAAALEDQGCSLVQLAGFHPEVREIAGMLSSIGFVDHVSIFPCALDETPHLSVSIRTPSGVRSLR